MRELLGIFIGAIILVTVMIMMPGCTEQEMARNYGGTETIVLEKGARLVNITWKSSGANGMTASSLWILTKQDTTKPVTYSFKEKSGFGVMEGEVIIKEQ